MQLLRARQVEELQEGAPAPSVNESSAPHLARADDGDIGSHPKLAELPGLERQVPLPNAPPPPPPSRRGQREPGGRAAPGCTLPPISGGCGEGL